MPQKTHCPYRFSLLLFFLFAILAFVASPAAEVLPGFWRILCSRSLLVTDYITVGGLGAALLNAAISGSMAVVAMMAAKVSPNGAILMAIWLTTGFSFFGKNVFNVLPIAFGVWLYSRLQREPFINYSLTAILSGTLAPVVSEFAFMGRWHPAAELAIGITAGIAAGFIMPVITSAATRVHGGYNLYNAGFAGGIIAMFITGICLAAGINIQRPTTYSSGNNLFVAVFLYLLSAAWLVFGLLQRQPNITHRAQYKKVLAHSGRLVTDYYLLYGGIAFVNMGLLGILSTTVVLLLGAQLTAAAIAGIFTIIAFGAFGKHPRNILPVMAGAIAMAALNQPNVADSGNICSILFSTGLAPISGQYGWYWGILAGALHMLIAGHIGQIAGGLNLYNNGFAAGFVALILVPIILAFKRGRDIRETEV